jgi:succinyl-diaminopimelate desuccinylase
VGSRQLAKLPKLMGRAGAMLVGEPTSNYPMVGHKGSLKFRASFKGVSAHGSMPQLGVNAIYKAAKAIAELEKFRFGARPHPIMGEPTMNVGTVEGGSGVNLVPDLATIGVDIRTVPGVDHEELISRLKKLIPDAELDVFANNDAVWTEPQEAWVRRVFEICQPILKETPAARTAPYMTGRGQPAQGLRRRADAGARARRGGDGAPDRRVLQHGAHPPVGADLRGNHPRLVPAPVTCRCGTSRTVRRGNGSA